MQGSANSMAARRKIAIGVADTPFAEHAFECKQVIYLICCHGNIISYIQASEYRYTCVYWLSCGFLAKWHLSEV